jgi:hypothetical protein
MAAKRISDLIQVGVLQTSAEFMLDTTGGTFKCKLSDILATPHTHGISDVTGLSTALSSKSDTGHTHGVSGVTGLETALSGKSDTGHTHGVSGVTGLETALSGKSDSSHSHALSAISGFPTYAAQTGVLTATNGVLSWAEVSGGNAVGDVAATPNTVAQRDASADIYAHSFISSSDRKLKKNVSSIDNGLGVVQLLQGKYFDWIANNQPDIGFIAQEIEEVLPIVVSVDNNGVKSINYVAIIPLLVEAIKTLSARLDALDYSSDKGE